MIIMINVTVGDIDLFFIFSVIAVIIVSFEYTLLELETVKIDFCNLRHSCFTCFYVYIY
jgi:hypothetical protein